MSYTRKLEITGILIIGVSLLFMLSIISYHPNDYGLVKTMPTSSIFSLDSGATLQVNNWLGVLGAFISHFFVHLMFGYMSLIIPLLLAALGWFVFRAKSLNRLVWPTIYGIWSMILFSTLLGWIYNRFDLYSSAWTGSSGAALSLYLHNLTGIGSIVILSLLTVVTLLILLDRDLQKTVDAVNHFFTRFKERRAEKKERRKEKKERKRKQKAAEAEEMQHPAKKSSSHSGIDNTAGAAGSKDSEEPASIDQIVEKSHREDLEKFNNEKKESGRLEERKPRAILEKEAPEEDVEDEEDVEISVFVGEGDEEAEDKALDRQNKDKARETPVIKYKFPTIDLLDKPPEEGNDVDMEEIRQNKKIILEKLQRHKIEILGINAIVGPTVTLYELEPAPDVKISKIQSYANDLKMATAAHGLRIIAPIPGRSAVGIEIPNSSRETVYIRSVINTKKFVGTDYHLPVAFGKTIENEVFLMDLTQMPHLLIAGATGSGKSVGINTIITCLLYKCHPDDLKFVMIDPKKIELSLYRNIQNHYLAVLPGSEEPIVTDTTRALETLQSLCKEMDERYELLKMAMVRDIRAYNEKYDAGELDEELGHRHLPYIVVIIDELADLMMTAGKQIEEPVARLAQLARAIGIHLVVATQRPSVNVITGTIKANFSARIAYQVASKVDSRTILDVSGADQLVGNGDMLFTNGGSMTRLQNAFVSTDEVEKITAYIGKQSGYKQPFYLPVVQDEAAGVPDPLDDIDEYFEAAAKVVILHQQGSVSLLQRKLKIGYNRAGRIIDQLFNAGIVGPYQGSSAREVLVDSEEELQEILEELDLS